MEVKEYPTLEEAQKASMLEGVTFPFVWHTLDAGKMIKPHKEKVAEWIIINRGKFTLTVGNSRVNRAHLTYNMNGSYCLVFWIPAGQRHALVAKSDLSYFVLKGK